MSKFIAKLKQEVLDAIPAIIFFAIAFNLIAFTKDLMLPDFDYNFSAFLTATIGALIVGKVIIIVNAFKFINAFPHKPLIYNIVWKIVIYSLALFIFRLGEAFLDSYLHDHNLAMALHHVDYIFATRVFWAIQLWVLMVLIVYVVVHEYIRALGKERVVRMLVGE